MSEVHTLTKSMVSVETWPLVTLHISSLSMREILNDLQKKIYQAPMFFKSAPLILSIDEGDTELNIEDMQILLSFLEQYHCSPIGWVGPSWLEPFAQFFKCAYWPSQPPTGRTDCAKVISEPVRAGQSIYHPGDLILLAPAHESSEILAGGNIHCYSRAEGRILAGVRGNKEAKIFCLSLEPQIVSIAGIFKTHDQFPHLQGPIQIALVNNELTINEIQS